MFHLHDRTRRRINLLVFLLVCVAPTAILAAWGVSRQLDRHVKQEARRLGSLLGMKVVLESMQHPRPGVVLYRGLELANSETGKTVLECNKLEASLAGNNGGGQLSLVLIADQPQLFTDELNSLGRLLDDVCSRRYGFDETQVRISAAKSALIADGMTQPLTKIQGRIRSSSERARAELSFRLADRDTFEPISMGLQRNRKGASTTNAFELSTGGSQLPCCLLATLLPALNELGQGSSFSGRIWGSQGPAGWEGAIAGQFSEVDLEPIFQKRSLHQMQGKAQVTFNSFRFCNGQVIESIGTASAGPGSISRSLIDATRYIGLSKAMHARTTPGTLLPFRRLAIWFCLDERGLHLEGRCEPQPSDVILADEYGPILGGAGSDPVPVANLIQTLIPPEGPQISVTPQTQWLMSWLPYPATANRVARRAEAATLQ
jgi:hypothetical protein